MNLKPGGKNAKPMRDGWFLNECGHKVVQKMAFSADHPVAELRGKAKGIRIVLEERALWPDGKFSLDCSQNKVQCSSNVCCARRLLASQPDFLEQKTALEEVVTRSGNIFDLYPKYHCEINFIERIWGYSKRRTRAECDYSFASLKKKVPESLNAVPLSSVRKFWRKSIRYIEAYKRGLGGLAAEWAVKKYKSHRRLGEGIEAEIEAAVISGDLVLE